MRVKCINNKATYGRLSQLEEGVEYNAVPGNDASTVREDKKGRITGKEYKTIRIGSLEFNKERFKILQE